MLVLDMLCRQPMVLSNPGSQLRKVIVPGTVAEKLRSQQRYPFLHPLLTLDWHRTLAERRSVFANTMWNDPDSSCYSLGALLAVRLRALMCCARSLSLVGDWSWTSSCDGRNRKELDERSR